MVDGDGWIWIASVGSHATALAVDVSITWTAWALASLASHVPPTRECGTD